jgi:lysozyme
MQAGLIKSDVFSRLRESFVPLRTIAIPPAERRVICDISGWNGSPEHGVNFATMKAAGVSAVYIKATQGLTSIDSQFIISRNAAEGILSWGVYHFVTTQGGVAQADHLLTVIGSRTGQLPITLDVEQQSISAQIIKDCVQRIEERTGSLPLIYTSVNFWGKVYGATAKRWVSDHCELWVAHWEVENPSIPYGWNDYVIHQYTANAVGVDYGAPPPPDADDDIDLNRCRVDWLSNYVDDGVLTIEERIVALENAARAHDWDV